MSLKNYRQLQQYRAQTAALEREWRSHVRTLQALPRRLGYKSINELIVALRTANKHNGSAGPLMPKNRKKRTPVTNEMKAQVKRLTLAGHSGRSMATRLNLSYPTVQKIKAELGLTKRPN